MENTASAGNRGPKIRSDCYVEVSPGKKGLTIDLESKVSAMFGNQILQQVREMAAAFGVKDAHVVVEDTGALPHVIDARLEHALAVFTGKQVNRLPAIIDENKSELTRERTRQSRLYLPGNSPALMINAGIHCPHGIILDLEDSVAPEKKEEARILVRNSLRSVNFYGAERMVRINQLPAGLKDAEVLAPHNVEVILIPKCESADQVLKVEEVVKKSLSEAGMKREVFYMPIIESCLGVEKAFEIASASDAVVAMAIGLEDYTADLGVERTEEGTESLYARTRMVNACKAAGIQPIDSVFSDVDNMDALYENARASRALGFEGMGCIHPRQINVIHKAFEPSEKEIEKAKKIVEAFEEAKRKGLGVVSLGSKMIDPPVVRRAEKVLREVRRKK